MVSTPDTPQSDAPQSTPAPAEVPAPAPTPAAAPAPAAETPVTQTAAEEAASAPPPEYRGRGGRGGGGFFRGGRGPRREERVVPTDSEGNELTEKVVFINRCAKVVKGGRRFSFSALVVSGNKLGKVGLGFGKANEVADAIKKASESAKNALKPVNIVDGTIPHEIYAEFGGGKVLLKPASTGTGVIAGGGMRAVCEVAGIRDVLGKSLGSSNHANVVKATLKALTALRTREQVLSSRGKQKREKAI